MKASDLKYTEFFLLFAMILIIMIATFQNVKETGGPVGLNPAPSEPGGSGEAPPTPDPETSGTRGDSENLPQPKSPYPPIIIIPADKFAFDTGKATWQDTSETRQEFNQLVSKIEERFQQYDEIDTVEVIGHTDGQQFSEVSGNLDKSLNDVARGERNLALGDLEPNSNADLGIMRALAVVLELKQRGVEAKCGCQLRAYSAAQLYLPNGEFADSSEEDDPLRRRIEVRFTNTRYTEASE